MLHMERDTNTTRFCSKHARMQRFRGTAKSVILSLRPENVELNIRRIKYPSLCRFVVPCVERAYSKCGRAYSRKNICKQRQISSFCLPAYHVSDLFSRDQALMGHLLCLWRSICYLATQDKTNACNRRKEILTVNLSIWELPVSSTDAGDSCAA